MGAAASGGRGRRDMTETNQPTDPGGTGQSHGRSGSRAFWRLRNYFLTGLVIAVPLFLTVYLTWAFVVWIDSWVTPLVPAVYSPDTYLPFKVPGFGVVVALFFITMLGFLTANIAGRRFVALGESILARVPLIRNLYRGLKQIVERAVSAESKPFQTVGLIEYPRTGVWSLVFVVNQAHGEIRAKIQGNDEDMLSCFVPTTPTALTGYVVFVPRSKVIILDMLSEDALKMIISAGLVSPDADPENAAFGKPMTVEEARKRVRAFEQLNRRGGA
jgi:uncharacterized membrane protein